MQGISARMSDPAGTFSKSSEKRQDDVNDDPSTAATTKRRKRSKRPRTKPKRPAAGLNASVNGSEQASRATSLDGGDEDGGIQMIGFDDGGGNSREEGEVVPEDLFFIDTTPGNLPEDFVRRELEDKRVPDYVGNEGKDAQPESSFVVVQGSSKDHHQDRQSSKKNGCDGARLLPEALVVGQPSTQKANGNTDTTSSSTTTTKEVDVGYSDDSDSSDGDGGQGPDLSNADLSLNLSDGGLGVEHNTTTQTERTDRVNDPSGAPDIAGTSIVTGQQTGQEQEDEQEEEGDVTRDARRYFREDDPLQLCQRCGESGHSIRKCEHVQCLTCGKLDDHGTRSCPLTMTCFRCGSRGHHIRDCPVDPSRAPSRLSGTHCSRCSSRLHSSSNCPYIWRVYIRSPQAPTGSSKPKMRFACYNCASNDHFGDDCKLPRFHPVKAIDRSAFTMDENKLYHGPLGGGNPNDRSSHTYTSSSHGYAHTDIKEDMPSHPFGRSRFMRNDRNKNQANRSDFRTDRDPNLGAARSRRLPFWDDVQPKEPRWLREYFSDDMGGGSSEGDEDEDDDLALDKDLEDGEQEDEDDFISRLGSRGRGGAGNRGRGRETGIGRGGHGAGGGRGRGSGRGGHQLYQRNPSLPSRPLTFKDGGPGRNSRLGFSDNLGGEGRRSRDGFKLGGAGFRSRSRSPDRVSQSSITSDRGSVASGGSRQHKRFDREDGEILSSSGRVGSGGDYHHNNKRTMMDDDDSFDRHPTRDDNRLERKNDRRGPGGRQRSPEVRFPDYLSSPAAPSHSSGSFRNINTGSGTKRPPSLLDRLQHRASSSSTTGSPSHSSSNDGGNRNASGGGRGRGGGGGSSSYRPPSYDKDGALLPGSGGPPSSSGARRQAGGRYRGGYV